MNIMRTMANLDPKDLSIAEVYEKQRLSQSCVGFLMGAGNWPNETAKDIFNCTAAKDITQQILKADERYSNLEHPVLIESTAAVATVWAALGYLSPPETTSYTNTRIFHRVATLLEGEAVANGFAELERGSDREEKQRREAQHLVETHDDDHGGGTTLYSTLAVNAKPDWRPF